MLFSCWLNGTVTTDGTSNWYVNVLIDLSKRAASGKINSSPITTLNSYDELSSDCSTVQMLKIPVSDPDGDLVKCFCTTNSCLPIVTLDSDTCVITFSLINGYYAIDITIQDFDVGSTVPKSSVPLQFIAYIHPAGTSNCRKIFFYLSCENHLLYEWN